VDLESEVRERLRDDFLDPDPVLSRVKPKMFRSRMLPLLLLLRLSILPRLARFDGETAVIGEVAWGLEGSDRSGLFIAESEDLRPRDAAVMLFLLVVRFFGRTSSWRTTPSPNAVGPSEEASLLSLDEGTVVSTCLFEWVLSRLLSLLSFRE
jgi:hypothetical protein